jgi:small subunit ribosomal protein S1
MSNTETMTEDFASLFAESIATQDLAEGYVAKGIVMAIEKDVAIIDVGLKVEGRVPLKEFGAKAKDGTLKVGDEVEVYVERIENALGEAVLSREKARREESWVRLEEKFNAQGARRRCHLQPGQGRLHRRSGRRRGLPAAQPGRHPPVRDVSPLMHTRSRSKS